MAELLYEGGELSMLLVAPVSPDGLPQVEALLSAERLQQWAGKLSRRKTHV